MTSNNKFERTVIHGGRTVLAMDCVLAGAEGASCPSAELGRQASRDVLKRPTEKFEQLVELFNVKDKREVRQRCRDLTVDAQDLAWIVILGRGGALADYRYACHFDQVVPDDVKPTDAEFEAFGRAKVGRLEGDALKFVRKTDQTMKVRRLFAAHLFYSPSHRYWHLFHFDQRDQTPMKNHWRHGAHIHYSNDLLVRVPSFIVWEKMTSLDLRGLNSVHIRYTDRRRDA